MSRHKEFIERYRYLIAGFLVAMLIGVTYYTDQFGVQDTISGFSKNMNKQKTFDVKDRCGLMPTSSQISHTISGSESCENECRARCASDDLEYKVATFELKEQGCNSCLCECD